MAAPDLATADAARHAAWLQLIAIAVTLTACCLRAASGDYQTPQVA